MEEICNMPTVLTLKDNVNHLPVVFSVNEFSPYSGGLWIEVAETNFEREKEQVLSIHKALVVLAHHRTPLIRHFRQVPGWIFQIV